MSLKRFLVLTIAVVFALALTVSADSITSVYSSLSGCKLVKTGHDWSTSACVGVGGYNLRLEYGDARESITIISPNGRKHPLNLWQVISGGFFMGGKKDGGGGGRRDGKTVALVLLISFDSSEKTANSTKGNSFLPAPKHTP